MITYFPGKGFQMEEPHGGQGKNDDDHSACYSDPLLVLEKQMPHIGHG